MKPIANWALAASLIAATAAAPATAQGTASSPNAAIEAFAPLTGGCYSAVVAGSANVDTHCYDTLYGVFVRDRHAMRAPGVLYQGETLYHANPETGAIVSRYYNQLGTVSDSVARTGEAGDIVFEEQRQVLPDGRELRSRGRIYDISEAGYSILSEQWRNGAWVEVVRQHFVRTGDAPPLPGVPNLAPPD